MTKTTSLFITGESLEDIEAWAETTFPRAFNKVKEYLNNRDIAVRQYKFTRPIAFAQTRESYKDGLLVGETTVLAQPIYARLLGTRARVEICVDNGRHGLYRLSSGFGKYLNEPFTWLGSQEDERSKNRLTALIVYLYLRSDKSMRNARNVWTFKEGFRSACNVLAVALDQKEGNAGGSDQSSPWNYGPNAPAARVATPPTPQVAPSSPLSTASAASYSTVSPATHLDAFESTPLESSSAAPMTTPVEIPSEAPTTFPLAYVIEAPVPQGDLPPANRSPTPKSNFDVYMAAAMEAKRQGEQEMAAKVHDLEIQLADAQGVHEQDRTRFVAAEAKAKQETEEAKQEMEKAQSEVQKLKEQYEKKMKTLENEVEQSEKKIKKLENKVEQSKKETNKLKRALVEEAEEAVERALKKMRS